MMCNCDGKHIDAYFNVTTQHYECCLCERKLNHKTESRLNKLVNYVIKQLESDQYNKDRLLEKNSVNISTRGHDTIQLWRIFSTNQIGLRLASGCTTVSVKLAVPEERILHGG